MVSKSRSSKNRGSKRVTRRSRDNKHMTVEGLHASFEKIDDKARAGINRGMTDSDLAACIGRTWTEQFHMDLSPAAVRGLVTHYRAIHRGTSGKRKTRKASQRGGMAPLSYTMGPGVTDVVYGRFPVPESGAANYDLNRFYESSISRACDSTGGAPAPGITNPVPKPFLYGGGVFDALGMGHPPQSVPPNVVQTTANALAGSPVTFPSSSPVTQTATLAPTQYQPYDVTPVTPITLSPVVGK
jgi:hypothetical protein